MRKLLIAVISLILIYSCGQNTSDQGSKDTTVKGRIINFKGERIYLSDVSDRAGLRSPENIPVQIRQEGTFQKTFHLEEPSYYKLGDNTLYITPGDDISMKIDYSDKSKAQFDGDGSVACEYLKSIPNFNGTSFEGYLGKDFIHVRKDMEDFISGYLLPEAEKSMKIIDQLDQVSGEFRELERARIKSNVVRSIMLYTAAYMRKFEEGYSFGDPEFRNKFNTIRQQHMKEAADVLEKYGKGLARADYIVLPEFRKILTWVTDTTGRNMPSYQGVERIDEYRKTERLLQKYARCFSSFSTNLDPNEVLAELEDAKQSMSTPLYKNLIDTTVGQYSALVKGKPAFDFVGFDEHGDPVHLSQFKGKYIYLDFWATWCHACIDEYPHFMELNQKFKDSDEIVFISVSTDRDKEKWQRYMQEHQHDNVSIHVTSNYLAPYKIAFIPRFILIDKDFTIYDAFAPRPSQPETEELLRSLI